MRKYLLGSVAACAALSASALAEDTSANIGVNLDIAPSVTVTTSTPNVALNAATGTGTGALSITSNTTGPVTITLQSANGGLKSGTLPIVDYTVDFGAGAPIPASMIVGAGLPNTGVPIPSGVTTNTLDFAVIDGVSGLAAGSYSDVFTFTISY